MKKGTLTLLVLFIFTTCYSQTNNTKKDKEKPAVSVKGAWTDADKKLAQEAIASVD